MISDRFELMKLWVPLGERDGYRDTFATVTPVSDSATNEAFEKASQFAGEGWELVEAIPILAGAYNNTFSVGYSFTQGYVLLFKRRIQDEIT